MLFNPVFINSTQNTQGSTKQNNFLGTSYLFSDIIKIYSTESSISNPLKEYSNFFQGENVSSIKGLFELKNSQNLLEIIHSKYNLIGNNTLEENKIEDNTKDNTEEVLKLTETDLKNILFLLSYSPESEAGLTSNEIETTTDTSSNTLKVKEIFELLDNQNKVSMYVKDGNYNYKLDIIPEQLELSLDSNNVKLPGNEKSSVENNQLELVSNGETKQQVDLILTEKGGKQALINDKNYEIKLTLLQNQTEEPEFIYFDKNIENDLSIDTASQKNVPVKTESIANLNKSSEEFTAGEIFPDHNIKQETDILASQLKKPGGNLPVNKEIEIKSGKSPIIENNPKTERTDKFDSNKIISSYKNIVKPGDDSLQELNEVIKKYSDKDFEIKIDKSVNEIKSNPAASSTKNTEAQKDIHSFNFELGKNIKEFAIKGGIKDLSFKQETKSTETKQPEVRTENNSVKETGAKNNFEPVKSIKEPVITEDSENQKIKENNNIVTKGIKEEEYSAQAKVKENTGNNSIERLTPKVDSQSKSVIGNSESNQNFSHKENSSSKSARSEVKEENDNSSIKSNDKVELKQEKNLSIDEKNKLNVKTQEEIKSFKEVSSNMSSEGELKPEPSHFSSENIKSFSKETTSFNMKGLTETIKKVPVSEIANEISSLIQKGEKKSLTLQLYPETLGKIKVTLDMFNKQVTARIEVENEAAKQAVQTNIEHLKESIHNQGVQINSVFVSLSNEDNKQQRTSEVKRKSTHISNDKKIDEPVESKTVKKMGYNTYEYLA
jgi:flagellar hook-length control protein FliK